MKDTLRALMEEIRAFGAANDQDRQNKLEKMRNVMPRTGALLALLVGATRSCRVLEIGTSNGYSTLWLADAVQPLGGSVTTVEFLPEKASLARESFRKAELDHLITLHLGDAGEYLCSLAEERFDFIFLDSERTTYPAWWPHLQTVLAPGGLIAVDNVLSHAEEVAPFLEIVARTPGYDSLQLPLDQGVQLIHKRLSPR